jgi:hypothetical protein
MQRQSDKHFKQVHMREEPAMPYMIPYYHLGILVNFRCTDCDWTYCIQNPCSGTVPRDEEEKAKDQYMAHRCSDVFKQNSEEVAGSL